MLADVGGKVIAGSFEGVEALVHRSGVGGVGTVEVGETTGPLLIVLVESPIEVLLGLLDLVEDHLEIWIHGS